MEKNIIEEYTNVALLHGQPYTNEDRYQPPKLLSQGVDLSWYPNKNPQLGNVRRAYMHKLSACFYHKTSVVNSLLVRKKDTINSIKNLVRVDGEEFYEKVRNSNNPSEYVLVFDYAETKFEFEAFLIQVKSLLDTLAQYIALAFGFEITNYIWANKQKSTIEALKGLTNNKEASKLARLFELHNDYWIIDLIFMRDRATHHGGVPYSFNYAVDLADVYEFNEDKLQAASVRIKAKNTSVTMEEYVNVVMKRSETLCFWTNHICLKEISLKVHSKEKQLSDFKHGRLKCYCHSGELYKDCHGA